MCPTQNAKVSEWARFCPTENAKVSESGSREMEKEKNRRANATKEKIYNALLYLLKRKKFNEIYVKDICTVACIHRSSFYEHYQDINDLMIKTEERLSRGIAEIFDDPHPFERQRFIALFEFIGKNSDFYSAYLNDEAQTMGQADFIKYVKATKNARTYQSEDLEFHMAFFSGGLQAVCKAWILSGMKKTPEQMADVIFDEYKENAKFFKEP